MSIKKTVLVTGGAEGIGASISQRLANDRYIVIGGDLNEQAGLSLASEISGEFMALDVSNPEIVESVIKTIVSKFGKLDILVKNAGILTPSPALAEQTVEDWQ